MFLIAFFSLVFEFDYTFLMLVEHGLSLLKLLLDGAEKPLSLSGLLLKRTHGSAEVAGDGVLTLKQVGVVVDARGWVRCGAQAWHLDLSSDQWT